MTRRRKQALVHFVLALGVFQLAFAGWNAIFGHPRPWAFAAGVSFVVAAVLLAFVWDVRPGGQIGGRS